MKLPERHSSSASRALPVLLAFALPTGATQFETAHPYEFVDADFTESVVGELTGNFLADVVVLRDGVPTVCISPGLLEASVDLATTAGDIAILPGGGYSGRDAIVIASDRSKLELWWYLADQTFTSAQIGSAIWADATEIEVGDVTGDGAYDIVGLASDGVSILVLPSPFTSGTEITVTGAATVYELELLDWNGVAPGGSSLDQEIAYTSAAGLRVVSENGLVHLSTSVGNTTDACLARLRHPGQNQDRLAMVAGLGGATRYVFVFDYFGSDPNMVLGAYDVVGVTSGDFSGDGWDDIAIVTRSESTLFCFENQHSVGAGFSFSWPTVQEVDPTPGGTGGSVPPVNDAMPVIADFDLDGDGDLVYPVPEFDTVYFGRNTAVEHRDQCLRLDEEVAGTYTHYPQAGTLNLILDGPVTSPPANLDQIEVIVYRRLDPDDPTEFAPLRHELFPRTSESISLELDPISGVAVFPIVLRFVELDESSRVLAASPAYVYTFSSNNESVISIHGDYGEGDIIPILDGNTPIGEGGGSTTGGPCVPCHPPGGSPGPPPPNP